LTFDCFFNVLLEESMDRRIILLVEDNADDEALTVRALKGNNILNPVLVAHDGQEALDYLFGQGSYAGRDKLDVPAVVLLDLKLPKMDGLEVLRQVRADEVTRLLPVVILTSSQEDQDLIDGYRWGCNSYIHKPVNFEQFRSVVRQLGLYWLVVNQPPPAAAGRGPLREGVEMTASRQSSEAL
jgi:CheY-like chemotaxis protein